MPLINVLKALVNVSDLKLSGGETLLYFGFKDFTFLYADFS